MLFVSPEVRWGYQGLRPFNLLDLITEVLTVIDDKSVPHEVNGRGNHVPQRMGIESPQYWGKV